MTHNYIQKHYDSLLKPIGAGVAMLIPLIIALITSNIQVATLGVMGSFSYLAFQNKSLIYNVKAIFIHGICLFFSFSLGIFSGEISWTIPFLISFVSFIAFLVTKLYDIPKPNYFFVLMLFAMGTNIKATSTIFTTSRYLVFGIAGSLISGIIISLLKKLPLNIVTKSKQKMALKDRYYVMIYNKPNTILNAIHFSMILFCSAYVSILFSEQSGYWILISSAAILAGEKMELIKKRSIQRILGSAVGLLFGIVILDLNFSQTSLFLILIILNILVEYFIPKNYTIANFFINPQVLILTSLASSQSSFVLAPYRLMNTIIGSAIAFFLMLLVTYGLEVSRRKY